MSYITPSSIERIKELSIYEVVSHYVDLKKAGANWRGTSPWHDEKTLSFYVVPSKNIFKDFSSGKGGSAIHFVMEKTGLSYPEAIKDIAGKCNVRLEFEDNATNTEERKKEVEHTETLYKLNEATARKYTEQLQAIVNGQSTMDHGQVAKELAKRQWTQDTIIQWQLGYAPDAWRFITDLAGDKSHAAAKELGLIKTDENKGVTYDTFRHRLMYPIHNHHGRIVGFGGRALPPSPSAQGDQKADFTPAKYLNSSESSIYKKENVLFGLHFAHEAIRKCGYAYLAEGYTDVISFHQAGYNVMVATCGTALTDGHCKLLRKYTNKVVLFRDGDEAGQKATLRDVDILLQAGFEVDVVPMPLVEGRDKVDPDDLTRMFDLPSPPGEGPRVRPKEKIKAKKVVTKTTKPKKP